MRHKGREEQNNNSEKTSEGNANYTFIYPELLIKVADR